MEGGSTQMPGGDAGCDGQMSSPSHIGSLLVEIPRCRLSCERWFYFNLSLHGRIDITKIESLEVLLCQKNN